MSIFQTVGPQYVPHLDLMSRLFCRPENTHKGALFAHHKDLNLLYWSDEGKHD